jgi:uncharacterized protein YoxC
VSGGEIAALIAAVAFVLLVGLLAVPILKLGRTLDQATKLLAGINEQTVPLLVETRQSLAQVNDQLARVDTITTHAQTVTGNVANLSSAFTAVLGGPLVKASALAYGVRKAVRGKREAEVSKRVKAEMKAGRAGLLRRRGRHAAEED